MESNRHLSSLLGATSNNTSQIKSETIPHATVPLLWDGGVPSHSDLRRKSKPLLEGADLNLMNVSALRLSPQFADLVRDGYSLDSFYYGDEGEWTKDSRIEATSRYF
jgi:hypothetical protein